MNKKKPSTEEIIRILPKADEGQTVEEDGWKAGRKFVQRIRRLGGRWNQGSRPAPGQIDGVTHTGYAAERSLELGLRARPH